MSPPVIKEVKGRDEDVFTVPEYALVLPSLVG